jgi:hypothetical protein
MNIISELYKGFAKRILDNMPAIIMVDVWNGQTEPFFGDENQLPLPAVFIDLRTNGIRDLGENIQELTMRVTFHVATDSIADTRISRNTDYTISEIHELTSQLHNLFQGYKGEFFQGTTTRKAIYPYEAQTNVLQIAQEYEFIFIDDSAQKIYDTETPIEGIVIESGAKPITTWNEFLINL